MFNKEIFKKRILFVGIPDMAYVCLDGLKIEGVNIVGVLGPKKNHPTYSGFKSFVQSRNLNFIEYDKLDDSNFIEKIKDLNADIAVVCSFNYKIPKVLLDSVKDGFINVHPSLLPKYRGPNPYSVVLLNGEKETGVTLHFMNEEFDTGNLIFQMKMEISEVETMGTLFNRSNILALDMLLETLRHYEESAIESFRQPEGEFDKGVIIPEDELFINFKKPAREINCLIRSLNPFVLARTKFRGTLMKVLSADVIEGQSAKNSQTGIISKIENDKFYVTTGDGLISITSMQFGSFFAGTAKEFIKILDPKIGEKFL